MNHLSTEVKAKEIHENAQFWHNRAEHNLYRFFLEVKEIRDNRYYKELGYSSFEDYSLDAWNIGRKTMDDRIKIANTFSEDDFENYSSQFGYKKTLLLTSMEEPQRERTLADGIPTEQGYKSYDEATQKEIADYKRNAEEMERKAKEYERQLETKNELISKREKENEILQSKLEEMENRDPEVIERYSEPDDYQETKQKLEQAIAEKEEYRQKLSNWHLSKKDRDEKAQKYDELNEAIKEMDHKLSKGQLRFKNRKFVNDLVTNSRILMKDVTPLVYSIESLHPDDLKQMTNSLNDLANDLYKISKDIKEKTGEGIVVNE